MFIFAKNNRNMAQTVYVMIGLPGSGKNTWINNNLGRNVKQVSRDDIRIELNMCDNDEKVVGTREQEQLVTQIFNKRLVNYVRNGFDVVINNINLKRRYRDDYKRLLSQFNVQWVYVVVMAPSIQDNIARRNGQIPKDILLKMHNDFIMPSEDEYDDIIIYQQKR
jgi:predicted kinase